MERGPDRRVDVIERRGRADAQAAVSVPDDVQLDRRLDLEPVDVGVDARLVVAKLGLGGTRPWTIRWKGKNASSTERLLPTGVSATGHQEKLHLVPVEHVAPARPDVPGSSAAASDDFSASTRTATGSGTRTFSSVTPVT